MTIFAISRKTIAAALLALAAVLFSTSVNALDRIYIASTHQVPVEVSCSNTAKATFTPTVSMTGSNLYYAASGDFGAYSSWAWLTYTLKEVPHGYDFVGWYSMARSLSSREPNLISDYTQFLGNEKTLILEYPVTEHKLYAYNPTSWQYDYPLLVKFEPISHTATFDYDFDGISVDVTETFDAKYNLPATPTRTGYTFVGWFRGKSSDEQISPDDIVKSVSDETFYAHWQPVQVMFALDPVSGSLGAYSSKITLTYDQSYDLPTPVWEGHTFNGWFTAASGGTKIAASGTCKFTADQKLYAQYTINRHEITYKQTGDGSGTISPTGKHTYDYGTKVELSATVNRGSEFIGWNDGVTDAEREITVTTNKTYSAEFRLKTFTVTFDPGMGTVSPTSKTVTFSKKFGELPTPRREGYNFDGWQTSGGTRITADMTVDLDDDIVLTAKYTIIRCAVQVIKAAGEGSGTVSGGGTYDYGYNLTIQAYPNDGSHFVAWNDGDTNASRELRVTSDATYAATFALNEYIVKFIYYNANGQQVTYSQQVKHGKAATPPANEVVDKYPRHTFTGWGNNQYGTVRGDMEIYALYDVYSYKVHFNPNCASYSGAAMLTQTFKVDEQKSLSLNTYERAGYDFIGWSRNPSDTTAMYINGQTVECLTDVKDAVIELYAIWKAREYEVSFDGNGGNAPSKNSIKVTYDSTYGTLPTCSRTGYTFMGWYTSATSGTKIEPTTKVAITSDQLLYAHWQAKTYSITYHAVNCSPTTAPESGTFAQALNLSWRAESATGYTISFESAKVYAGNSASGTPLQSWVSGTGGQYKMEDDYHDSIYIELIYTKTANTYTVRFNSGGGTSCDDATVTYDGKYGALPTTNRTGYTFGGWWTASSGGAEVKEDTTVKITGTQTLYAHWTAKTYTVTTEAVMCTINAPATGTFEKPYSFSWTAPEDKKGYTISNPAIAIYRGADTNGTLVATYSYGTSTSYTMSVTYSEALHITGRYTYTPNKYTVEFDTAGGGSVSSQQVTYDAAYGTLPEPKKKNHKFCGWWDAEGNLIDETTIVSIAENHTLTAKWERETYTIRFDPGEGEGNMSDQVANCGEATVLKANTFTKVGYLFEDWVCGDGESYHSDGATVKDLVNANEIAVLTAEWTNIVYTIAFDANWKLGDGVLKSEVPEPLTECKYDKVKKLTVWTPETGGMAAFCGWALDPSAEEPDYINGEKISNLTTVGGATVTLYAVWEDTLSELSRAVGCNNANLVAEAGRDDRYALVLPWKPCESGGGIGSGEVTLRDKYTEASSRLSLVVSTNGTMVFVCKMTTPGAKGVFKVGDDIAFTLTEVTESTRYVYEATGAKGATFAWWGYGPEDSFVIESLRWYPGLKPDEIPTEHPKPTEADRPVIASDFKFATNPDFDYVIWRATTLENGGDWVAGDPIEGDGNPIELPMFEGTQGFFKVEVVKRGTK